MSKRGGETGVSPSPTDLNLSLRTFTHTGANMPRPHPGVHAHTRPEPPRLPLIASAQKSLKKKSANVCISSVCVCNHKAFGDPNGLVH